MQIADEIYCTEISNEPKSTITTDIRKQLHYDTWREIDKILASVADAIDGNAANRHSGDCFYACLFVHLLVGMFCKKNRHIFI